MNRNTVIGLLLIGAIFIGWSIWMSPSAEELEAQERERFVRDSTALVEQAKAAEALRLQEELRKQEVETQLTEGQSTVIPASEEIQVQREKYGSFASAASGDEQSIYIENDVLRMEITNKGGRIKSVELKNYMTYDTLPLILFDSDTSVFGFTFFANNRLIRTNDLYFQPEWVNARFDGQKEIKISGDEEMQFAYRLYTDSGDTLVKSDQYIEYLYTVKGSKYMIDYDVRMVNMESVIDANTSYLSLEWATSLRKQERGVDRWNGPTVYYKYHEDDVDYLSETKDDEEELKTQVKWISYKQHFFTSTLIAKNFFNSAIVRTYTLENPPSDRYLKTMVSEINVPYSAHRPQDINMQFYFGPNKYKTLRKYKLDLERQIPLGWSFRPLAWINIYIVLPVFNFLEQFGWNYGIIILVLTLLLKLVLFPIAYKTYKSSARMRVLKPEIDEINKKYPKKEDAMKKQQETMGLYRKAGVNPAAGCVPMLLQMPILIALFRFFPSSIELRQQAFLWANDLSSYDAIVSWTTHIPLLSDFYGNHVSLFTLLMTISTIMYTRINNQMMASSQQMPGMKTMMYIMPIMFLGIFNNYASGLSYYYLLANLITFGQMFLIRRTIDEDKLRAQIEKNKKKPKKKSSFQKRLEDAAKKRGYQAPKK